MRIGSSTASSHQAGMSSLWHDVDYVPQKELRPPTVEKGQEGMPLPSEQHQLPEGAEDPFAKQDAAFDVAAQQMDRGLKGCEFLHGRDVPHLDPIIAAQEVTRTMMQHAVDPNAPTVMRRVDDARAVDGQILRQAAASNAPPKVSNAVEPSNSRQQSAQAMQALQMAETLGVGVVGMLATQGIEPTGAAGQMMAEAAQVVKAVTAAKVAVGMSKSVSEAGEADYARAVQDAARRRKSHTEKE